MQAVRARLSNLEKRFGGIHGPGLLVVLKAGPSEADVDRVLQEAGIDRDNPSHLIVILRTIYEARDGGLADRQPKAELLYTQVRH